MRSKPHHNYIVATKGDTNRLFTTNSIVVRRLAKALGLVIIEVEW